MKWKGMTLAFIVSGQQLSCKINLLSSQLYPEFSVNTQRIVAK